MCLLCLRFLNPLASLLWRLWLLRSPVVVSDTGGLSEIIEHDVTGVKVYPNNPDSLAWGIAKILLDGNYAKYLKRKRVQTSPGKV